ncbi:hypothetical protein GLOIN_2v1885930 [Rhizophagus clarus]|uniref:Uncharacterized protein n=1 Tax=Rhizophagus clarus TaxID=94130 RepID=A0A8H3LSB3_9GLOM|nr:hypothetical protein GLOIN_2v1885930 [Rhizophagus clarus]
MTRRFKTQLREINTQGAEEEKKNAIRLKAQFNVATHGTSSSHGYGLRLRCWQQLPMELCLHMTESRKMGLVDSFWTKRQNFTKYDNMMISSTFLSCDGIQIRCVGNNIQGQKQSYENREQSTEGRNKQMSIKTTIGDRTPPSERCVEDEPSVIFFFPFYLPYDVYKFVSNLHCSSKSNDHDESDIEIHEGDDENPFIINNGDNESEVNISKSTNSICNKQAFASFKTILSWQHAIDNIDINDASTNDVNIEKYYEFIVAFPDILLNDKQLTNTKWCENCSRRGELETDEEKDIFDCTQIISRNFFNENKELDEDTFIHRYCHLMLEELFNKTDFALVWANSESASSKERRILDRKNHGRKPDFWVLSKINDINVKFLFGEIKSPLSTNPNKSIVKLAEFMKGSLDFIINRYGYASGLETYGILICGSEIKIYCMDLIYDGLYRCNLLSKMLLPTENANFINIINVISTLYSLADRIRSSVCIVNSFQSPIQSYCRKSNSSPQKIHSPGLEVIPYWLGVYYNTKPTNVILNDAMLFTANGITMHPGDDGRYLCH